MSLTENNVDKFVNSIRSRGRKLIYPQHIQAWDDLIKKNFNSLHILNEALTIMEALENGKGFEEARSMCNVTGDMAVFMDYVVLYYSKFGPDYIEATTLVEISDEDKERLEEIRAENAEFEEQIKSIQRSILK